MFLFITATNCTFKSADPVADSDRGPYVPGSIKTVRDFKRVLRVSVCPFGRSKTPVLFASVALELVEERHVSFCILPVRKIWGIAIAQCAREIALQLDADHTKILKNKIVFLVTTREIGVANQASYNKVQYCACNNVVEVD